MTSTSAYFRNSFLLVAFFLLSSVCLTASAQNTTLNSRISLVTNDTKTNIWISDFPKKTSIVIFDTDDNLLSIVSTNDFGAAYVSLPTSVKTRVIVKTLNGEVKASNEAVIKKQDEQTALSAPNKDATKA
jgi:hypothetical protein